MKRKLSILLVAVLMALAIVSPAMAGNEKLTYSYWGSGLEKASVEAALAQFTAETGIEVEPLHIPQDYLTKLTTMAAAGTMPDVGYMSEDKVIEWALDGMFESLTDLYNSESFSKRLETNLFRTPDGDIVGMSMANETIIMFYNKAIFDAEGLEYPPAAGEDAWTWDEFIEVCRKLTKDANGKTPNDEDFDPTNIVTYGARIGKYPHIFGPLLVSNGGGIYSPDYREIWLDKPESIEVLQKLADMIHVEHVHPSPDQSATVPSTGSAFLSNRLAMDIDGQWSLQSISESAREDGIEFDVGVLPKFKDAVTSNTGAPTVVFSGTAHKEDAMLLAEFILDTDKVIDLIHSGLWQPTEANWYTDDELINQWLVPGVHPANYRTAVIDYTRGFMVANPFFSVPTVGKINDLFVPALDPAWIGTATVQECIDGVIGGVNEIFDEYLASLK